MRYNNTFLLILFISSILGVLIGIYSNNLIDYQDNYNVNENLNKLKTNTKEKQKQKEKQKIEKEKEEKKEEGVIEEEQKDREEKEEIIDNYIDEVFYKNKLRIAISYSTDNKYIYPTIVAMTSLVEKAGNSTFYDIYITHTPDFTEYSKNFLKTVEKKYPEICKIIFLNMGNKYKGLKLNFRLATSAYYRLSLHELLPNVKRIIYMDGDTLVFEDLTELIKLDMKGNIIMGFLDVAIDAIKSFGFENATVLCSGVLLMDLEALRKYDYSKKINDFITNYRNKLDQHDQTIINVVFQGKIAPLPPKYGMWAWMDENAAKRHLDVQRPWLKYNEQEYFYAVYHPAILHYIWPKPFWKRKTAFYEEWWDYAKKTGFYNDIYTKSPVPKIKWRL